MCKNANNPCPGCTRHDPQPQWMFLTEEERRGIAPPPSRQAPPLPVPTRDIPAHSMAGIAR